MLIAKVLHVMNSTMQGMVKGKFNIAFLIAKENMAFTEMKAMCELEERHEVDLGTAENNTQSCATFLQCIAK